MKTINLLWLLSLVLLGIGTVFLAGASLLNIELADFVMRAIGIIDFVALPVLGYTTVKRVESKQKQNQDLPI